MKSGLDLWSRPFESEQFRAAVTQSGCGSSRVDAGLLEIEFRGREYRHELSIRDRFEALVTA